MSQTTLRAKAAVGRWHHDWSDACVFLPDGDRQIRVDSVGLRQMQGAQAVSVYCEFQKWDDGWVEVPADPHQHYLLVGPPESLANELWDLFDTVTSPEHYAQIQAALERGENVQSTTVFYGSGYDGYIWDDNASWVTAYDLVGGAAVNGTDTLTFGTKLDGATDRHFAYEAFIAFDTNALGTGVVVSAASLELYGASNYLSAGACTLEARAASWGGTVTAGDAMTRAQLFAAQRVAQREQSWGWSTSGYNVFSSTPQMPAFVNRTGQTQFVICTTAQSQSSPYSDQGGWQQYARFWAGTTAHPPKLTVTYAAPVVPPPVPDDVPDDDPVMPPAWVAAWGDSGTVDFDKRVVWPTIVLSDDYWDPGGLVLGCEEGVSAEERDVLDAASPTGRTPGVDKYVDYIIPIPSGGLPIPACELVLAMPYRMPVADAGDWTVDVTVTFGSWTSAATSVVLPHTNDEVMTFGIPITIPGVPPYVWGNATTDKPSYVRIKTTAYAGSGTKMYPLPIDLVGTVPCARIGLKPDQGVTVWNRPSQVLILESPHAGSHSNPTLVSGLPVMKLTADGVYPNDIVTVTAYADSKRDQTHSPDAARTQIDVVEALYVTESVMPFGALRRYMEVGKEGTPWILNPPDAAKDNAPGVVKWLPGRWYQYGTLIIPTHPWSHFYRQEADDAGDGTGGGWSGSVEPSWMADGSAVVDNECSWTDAGERYSFGSNTFYVMTVTSAMGTLYATVELETLLDVLNSLAVDVTIAPPQLYTVPDCTSADEVTLGVHKGPSHDQNPLAVEIELTYPDGTVQTFTPGITLEQFVGRLGGS